MKSDSTQKFAVGNRVELHPACDLWMRGAKYGDIRRIAGQYAFVEMDHPQVTKLQKVHFDLLQRR